MRPSMTHSMLTGHLRWFENQTRNRPPDRVNSKRDLTDSLRLWLDKAAAQLQA